MTEAGGMRRGVATGVVLAILIAVAAYLAVAATAHAQVMAVRAVALIGGWKGDRTAAAPALALSDATIRKAITARPLDARSVNVAMFRAYVRSGDAALARWMPVAARLGWRDTPTLQNRLFAAATDNDLRTIMDVSDALMRRQQLQEQVIPMLSIVEGDASVRTPFARRLLAAPPWRDAYLFSAGYLRTPEQLAARAALLDDLRRGGFTLERNAIRSNVEAMTAGGQPRLAFALWAAARGGPVSRPLFDPDFAIANRDFANGQLPVAFEWNVESGNGFSANPYVENGRAAIDIRWNGRGVPVVLRQRTSGTAGRYRLDVRVAPEKVRDLSSFAFRLVCGNTSYPMNALPGRPASFETPVAIPCDFATFEVMGDVAAEGTPRQLDLYGLRLTRIGGAADRQG